MIAWPAWVRCDLCEDFICTIHGGHVYDCPCPPIEEWPCDPYTAGGRRRRGDSILELDTMTRRGREPARLTFGSLFAGIGGFDLGLERAGFACAWQVEIDPFCRAVLAKHWPHVQRYEDVRRVGAHNLARVDLICGGFPCQDISDAGQHKGIHGERSGLWSEFARVVREVRPRYVLVENVAALVTRGLGVVLADLAALGFDAEWDVLRAADVGAPHARARLFIVARLADAERARFQGAGQTGAAWRAEPPALVGGGVVAPVTLWPAGPDEPQHGWEPPRVLATQSALGRVSDGVPGEVGRTRPRRRQRQLAAFGNAVVPQLAEWIGRAVLAREGGAAPPPGGDGGQ